MGGCRRRRGVCVFHLVQTSTSIHCVSSSRLDMCRTLIVNQYNKNQKQDVFSPFNICGGYYKVAVKIFRK